MNSFWHFVIADGGALKGLSKYTVELSSFIDCLHVDSYSAVVATEQTHFLVQSRGQRENRDWLCRRSFCEHTNSILWRIHRLTAARQELVDAW